MTEEDWVKRSLEYYGIRLSSNLIWFIDDGITHYGVIADNKIAHFISGYITGTVFALCYSSINEALDKMYWVDFLYEHFDLTVIDTR